MSKTEIDLLKQTLIELQKSNDILRKLSIELLTRLTETKPAPIPPSFYPSWPTIAATYTDPKCFFKYDPFK